MYPRRFQDVVPAWGIGAASVLLLMGVARPLLAQNEVTVTVYYVRETDACRPNGYSHSNATDRDACETLSYESDVRNWERNRGVPRQSFSLRAKDLSAFSLEKPLREIVHQYTNSFDKLEVTDHRAGVFVFDFGDSLEASVSLMRRRLDQETTSNGSLNGERRWIFHQEAHWLHWFNEITWTLKVNGRAWSFEIK